MLRHNWAQPLTSADPLDKHLDKQVLLVHPQLSTLGSGGERICRHEAMREHLRIASQPAKPNMIVLSILFYFLLYGFYSFG